MFLKSKLAIIAVILLAVGLTTACEPVEEEGPEPAVLPTQGSSLTETQPSDDYSAEQREVYLLECVVNSASNEVGFCNCTLEAYETVLDENQFLSLFRNMVRNQMNPGEIAVQKSVVNSCIGQIPEKSGYINEIKTQWFAQCPVNGLNNEQCGCTLEGLVDQFDKREWVEVLYAGLWGEITSEQKAKQETVIAQCAR